nr:hypothetical protein [Tanacetum cinerariifolium]
VHGGGCYNRLRGCGFVVSYCSRGGEGVVQGVGGKWGKEMYSSVCLKRTGLKNPPSKYLVFEEPELGKLEVGKPGVDKQEREENQEVKFDLTSSKDDS